MIQIKNETQGYLSLTLDDSTGVKPAKTFRMVGPQVISIPDDYADSIYNNEGIKDTLEKGYFSIVKGKEQLEGKAIANDYTTKEELNKIELAIVPNPMLLAALKDGSVDKVKEYLASKNRERLIMLAKDNIDSISIEKIRLIEDTAGVTLTVDE